MVAVAGSGIAHAARTRPTRGLIVAGKRRVLCVETRGSEATVGDIDALSTCKVKPGRSW
jgi:hypothetical protein